MVPPRAGEPRSCLSRVREGDAHDNAGCSSARFSSIPVLEAAAQSNQNGRKIIVERACCALAGATSSTSPNPPIAHGVMTKCVLVASAPSKSENQRQPEAVSQTIGPAGAAASNVH
jgi:hypothetical protein